MALASCGIPEFPYLAKPISVSLIDTNDTFEFRNDPGSSSIFQGFELYYRLYENGSDADADSAAIAPYLTGDDGHSTLSKLLSLDFELFGIAGGEYFEPDDDPADAYEVTVNLSDSPGTTPSIGNVITPHKLLTRRTGTGLIDFYPLDSPSSDIESARNGIPGDASYFILVYVCARGFDAVSIKNYRSQFIGFKLEL